MRLNIHSERVFLFAFIQGNMQRIKFSYSDQFCQFVQNFFWNLIVGKTISRILRVVGEVSEVASSTQHNR